MNTVTVWNRGSTNYAQNAFVRANGTDTAQFDTEAEALAAMNSVVNSSLIERAVVEGPKGRLTWERYIAGCGCDASECNTCEHTGGCPGNDDLDDE